MHRTLKITMEMIPGRKHEQCSEHLFDAAFEERTEDSIVPYVELVIFNGMLTRKAGERSTRCKRCVMKSSSLWLAVHTIWTESYTRDQRDQPRLKLWTYKLGWCLLAFALLIFAMLDYKEDLNSHCFPQRICGLPHAVKTVTWMFLTSFLSNIRTTPTLAQSKFMRYNFIIIHDQSEVWTNLLI